MKFKLMLLLFLGLSSLLFADNNKENNSNSHFSTEWILNEFIKTENQEVELLGSPKLIKTIYGDAVHFNGMSDGIILNGMPIKGLTDFTIEAIFKPESGGQFEQRFLHCGEVLEDRFLFEIRVTKEGWYFDSFIKSGENKKALMDSALLHPYDQWYHVAFICENGLIKTFVNGEQELSNSIPFNPLASGKTSIGVRQNKRSWFHGSVYAIRISPTVLNPTQFMTY